MHIIFDMHNSKPFALCKSFLICTRNGCILSISREGGDVPKKTEAGDQSQFLCDSSMLQFTAMSQADRIFSDSPIA
ncbi:MAG: hypothetical protein B7X28_00950 [Halothiobacillus sp. 13-55-253]|nr:MAG: hypothetical protein B7X28_00950 [Halothiobacillus sp. 13-55-253]